MKIGDVVKLKSGGPSMTVVSIGSSSCIGEGNVECTWFTKGGVYASTYPITALYKTKAKP